MKHREKRAQLFDQLDSLSGDAFDFEVPDYDTSTPSEPYNQKAHKDPYNQTHKESYKQKADNKRITSDNHKKQQAYVSNSNLIEEPIKTKNNSPQANNNGYSYNTYKHTPQSSYDSDNSFDSVSFNRNNSTKSNLTVNSISTDSTEVSVEEYPHKNAIQIIQEGLHHTNVAEHSQLLNQSTLLNSQTQSIPVPKKAHTKESESSVSRMIEAFEGKLLNNVTSSWNGRQDDVKWKNNIWKKKDAKTEPRASQPAISANLQVIKRKAPKTEEILEPPTQAVTKTGHSPFINAETKPLPQVKSSSQAIKPLNKVTQVQTLPPPPPDYRLHTHMRNTQLNMMNMLDCLEDVQVHEQIMLEETLNLFIQELEDSVPYNSYKVRRLFPRSLQH